MTAIRKCPVCGRDNTRTYYTLDYSFVCEDYYCCKHCGYFYEMAYSEYYEGIAVGRGMCFFRRLYIRWFKSQAGWRKQYLKRRQPHF